MPKLRICLIVHPPHSFAKMTVWGWLEPLKAIIMRPNCEVYTSLTDIPRLLRGFYNLDAFCMPALVCFSAMPESRLTPSQICQNSVRRPRIIHLIKGGIGNGDCNGLVSVPLYICVWYPYDSAGGLQGVPFHGYTDLAETFRHIR